MQVTVVIPTFKRLNYLKQAIDSVCQQTWQDFVCIVINDYPSDALAVEQLITSFNDDRLRLINHEASGGGNAARNTGIKEAEGDIIAFLDDDDCWLPHKLECHLKRHQAQPEVGVVFSGMIKRWSDDLIPDYFVRGRLPSEGVVAAMRGGTFCPLTTSAVSVRRKCFTECGLFDTKLASFQDWDMWYRLANQYEFDYIEDALLIFRQHLGDRTSKTKERRFLGLQQLVTKWHSDLADPQQFKAIFIKDTYVSSIYNSILRSSRKAALQDWYTLLKLSNTTSDFSQLIKLMLMWAIGTKNYGRVFKK